MRYCLQCGCEAERKIPATDNIPRLVCPNCHYIHYENPKIICGSLVVHKHRVLLCRRAIEPQYGFWTLPAGFMENGETLAEAAARETWEEACAQVRALELYTLFDLPHIHQVYMFFRAELHEGAFGIGEESLEVRLFHEHEIPWSELAFPTIGRTLECFFADRKHRVFPVRNEAITRWQKPAPTA